MKTGGLVTAIGVLAILVGTLWWTNKHPTVDAKSKTPDAPKILSLDPKQINDIRIAKTGADPVELVKLAQTWEITKPEMLHADQDAADMLANSVATLTADRLIDDHPSDLNAFGLTTPAMEVDVSLKGGKTSKLLVGADTPAATGTYVKLDSDPKVFTVPTSTKSNFDRSANDLRDKRLLTFNQDKLTSIT